MKKLLSILICLSLLLPVIPAMATGLSDVMCVTNCSEWVSLRESSDSSSKRLAKVHLGELVTNCTMAYDGFIECEFGGKTGYIQNKYLKTTPFTMYESFPGNQMVINVSEYASMLDSPDSSGKRVTKVPVGSIVTSCVRNGGKYTYCEYKSGKKVYTGWISNSYLKKANYDLKEPSSKVTPMAGTEVNGMTLTVINCENWVSLREKASTSASRLAKVPLGAQVDNCIEVSDTFVYCSYLGIYGYIQSQYLSMPQKEPVYNNPEPDPDPEPDPQVSSFSSLPVLPDFATFLTTGRRVLTETYAGYTIAVQRLDGQYEEMLAVCYDLTNKPLWRLYGQSLSELSDVVQLDAFVAGTIEDPQLIWYIKGLGLYSYSFGPVLQLRWFLPNDLGLDITDSIVHAEDYDGSFYIAFSDVLMHISADGKLLWRTSCDNTSIFWPVSIELGETGISVLYDNLFGINNMHTEVRFSTDGKMQYITQRAIPKEA